MKHNNNNEFYSLRDNDNIFISIIVPVFNEEEVLPEFHKRLSHVLNSIPLSAEILYINDGSVDNSLRIINDFHENNDRVAIIDLSRNFGKEIALTAGLDYAKGDAVVIIDADLQDPPELILEFCKYWLEGYDVVYGKRIARDGESVIKKTTAHFFYRLMQKIGKVKIPRDTGDFRLLSRSAVESLKQFKEQHRFMKGLFTLIGYPQKAVLYRRDPRYAGVTKWDYWKLWNFAIEGITSFTIAPLKIATYLGFITALSAFIYAAIIIYKTLIFGEPVKGYPSLMVVILFLGGVQLITTGIIGEYLGRVFDETKQRPLYFLKSYEPSSDYKSEVH
jgi:glycosyltransferase involved in cell wall biosynthesis